MKYKRISGNTPNGNEIKGVGDVIKIDGVSYEVTEINTYNDEYAEVHEFDYTLKVVEKTAEEMQKL